METKLEILKKSIFITVGLFILSVIYTCTINSFAQIFFTNSANGSLIVKDGEIIGSKYIGQAFTEKKYFHGRPSVNNYNTYNTREEAETLPISGGSNLAISNPNYIKNIETNIEKLLLENPNLEIKDIPSEMITASGSGLDPHITVQGAFIQAERVARENKINKDEIIELINKVAHKDIINVLELNLALENLIKE